MFNWFRKVKEPEYTGPLGCCSACAIQFTKGQTIKYSMCLECAYEWQPIKDVLERNEKETFCCFSNTRIGLSEKNGKLRIDRIATTNQEAIAQIDAINNYYNAKRD